MNNNVRFFELVCRRQHNPINNPIARRCRIGVMVAAWNASWSATIHPYCIDVIYSYRNSIRWFLKENVKDSPEKVYTNTKEAGSIISMLSIESFLLRVFVMLICKVSHRQLKGKPRVYSNLISNLILDIFSNGICFR